MAKNVTIQVTGGEAKPVAEGINTVQEAKEFLGLTGNYTATVNGDGAEMSDELKDYAFVTFSESVKGGL